MTPLVVAKLWLKAFNEHQLDALLELYDEHAEHFSPKLKIRNPETNGLIKGKAAMRAWWQDAFDRLPELYYHEERLTANDTCVFMEYTRKVGSEPDMRIAEILEISNGKIVASKVYHG